MDVYPALTAKPGGLIETMWHDLCILERLLRYFKDRKKSQEERC